MGCQETAEKRKADDQSSQEGESKVPRAAAAAPVVPPTEGPVLDADHPTVPSESTPQTLTRVAAGQQRLLQRRIGSLFEQVLPTLEKARALVDRHEELPDISHVPFVTDKESNSVEINKLLDQAIERLEISSVSDYRQQIREIQQSIQAAHRQIADYRRRKVSAPRQEELSRLEKVNPFVLTKEGCDELVASAREQVQALEAQLIDLKRSFAEELQGIGLQIDGDAVDSLLSSVSGDDIVSMAIVFDNIKHLTTQLQRLSEESSEAPDVAKRYYGMYVVMVQIMDRLQKTFVSDIHDVHIPKLEEFVAQAATNIDQAERLIDTAGGDAATLRANIASNELTRETARLYVDYLEQNAALIAADNREAQKNLATAMNTYMTVRLSSDVANLMETGRRNFDTLMKLRVPPMREFDNAAIRKEFERMTAELRAAG